MTSLQLTLIGKPDCHLCEDAHAVVTGVIDSLPAGSPEIALDEVSILDDAELYERHWEEIPVLLINGKVHNYWRIDPDRLRTAILEQR
ncbi:glutaredoxin family protein [Plantibacter sp. Mn2098]|uniref:glutaredoxin family protein n=1 Tax=Plantibacter sp. Mn2098 TaxID=3395266 RepID=UPI003BC41D2D